jgi:hypothetical protein
MFNSSPISFQSRINFIDSTEFAKLPLNEMKAKKEYSAYPWDTSQIIMGQRAYTDGAYGCCAGGITNGKNAILFHLIPNLEEHCFYKIKLKESIEKLKESGNKLNAFVTGGHINVIEEGAPLFNMIKKLFKENNIETSYVWNQKYGCTDLYYSTKEDEWKVHKGFEDAGIPDIHPLDYLKDRYYKIHISDNDELLINGKGISKKS